ncbi:iron-containing alcohol dehydrogenase [Parapusillimonas granuli]|uniref:Iron-containing alcohol dehydrogenase n=2 Tax=Parapusillimonas granuli TaxID=380911 RepID=A0A853FZX6_9BURK|nr:iron-containing alcohol dehydrogenase [Parapusillimonas granuli]NYT49637.1 iron-containing alcohol dehydrogenase [Parapusillimonas granuli]
MQLDYGVMRAPARLIFGPGQRKALGRAAASLGSRALICTDTRLANSPLMQELLDDLAAHDVSVEVFDGTEPELPLEGIRDCVDRHREFRPEVIIGIGGGSCMDLAKMVSLLMKYPEPVSQYYGEFKVPGPIVPVIAIPTTAGTGSEVTPVAVIADSDRAVKVGISSPELIPHTAICDPELTLSCPAGLTAISGADAFAHALEAFSAIRRPPAPGMAMERVFVGKNVLSDQYALSAMRLIFANLEKAVKEGSDIEARSAVMLGSTYAGLAFGTAGTCAAHAIQYPVGAQTHTAHGLGIGVLLPYTMEFNVEACESVYAEVARAIGVDAGGTDHEAAHAGIAAVRALFQRIGIPVSLRELDVKDEDLDQIAELSMGAARLVENNPRILDKHSVRSILDKAMSGA